MTANQAMRKYGIKSISSSRIKGQLVFVMKPGEILDLKASEARLRFPDWVL